MTYGGKGFSLTELMVATGLLASVGIVIVMVYTGTTRTWFSIEDRIDINQSLRAAAYSIAMDVRMAKWIYEPEVGESSAKLSFKGADDVVYEYVLEDGEIFKVRNGETSRQLIASFVASFEVKREKRFRLDLKMGAEERGQEHEIVQSVKLRNLRAEP